MRKTHDIGTYLSYSLWPHPAHPEHSQHPCIFSLRHSGALSARMLNIECFKIVDAIGNDMLRYVDARCALARRVKHVTSPACHMSRILARRRFESMKGIVDVRLCK